MNLLGHFINEKRHAAFRVGAQVQGLKWMGRGVLDRIQR